MKNKNKEIKENKKKTIKNIISEKIAKAKENSEKEKRLSELIEDWKDVMYETNNLTETNKTFTLLDTKEEVYGFKSTVIAPKGTNINDLEKYKQHIETGLKCIFLYTIKKGSNIASVKFIKHGFGGNNVQYIPPKTTAFELYLGNSIDGTPAIVSVKDVSHFLLSGSNGSGKSRMLDCMITTLIHNCSEAELELYLCQISKNDLVVYEDAKCCRAFCENLDEVEIALKHIIKKMDERDKLIKPMRKDFKGSNISDFNKLYPNRKLSVCWIIFDEVASVMNKNGNTGEVKQQKDRIIAMMENIARVGRALGIFLGVCLQRPKAESLSPDVKAQANLRISFSQNNIKSSEVAMDDSNIAVGLDERVAVYTCRANGFDFIKTPYIDDEVIKTYVLPKCQRGHRNLFTDLEKLKESKSPQSQPKIDKKNIPDQPEQQPQTKDKGTAPLPPKPQPIQDIQKPTIPQTNVVIPTVIPQGKISFDKVDPIKITTEHAKIEENIKKIPNFVPINPNNKPKIVIDQTKIDFSKTQKPIKKQKGEEK